MFIVRRLEALFSISSHTGSARGRLTYAKRHWQGRKRRRFRMRLTWLQLLRRVVLVLLVLDVS
jgi:hypothetical protein